MESKICSFIKNLTSAAIFRFASLFIRAEFIENIPFQKKHKKQMERKICTQFKIKKRYQQFLQVN